MSNFQKYNKVVSAISLNSLFLCCFKFVAAGIRAQRLGGGASQVGYVIAATMTEQPTCTNSDYLVAIIAISIIVISIDFQRSYSIVFPPLAVALKKNICSGDTLINLALCCLGYFPGMSTLPKLKRRLILLDRATTCLVYHYHLA